MTVPVAGRGPQLLAVYGLFTALTTITIALRVYCRTIIGRNFGWDDGLAITAWTFFICHAAFAISGVHHGTGQHALDIKPATEIPVALKFWWLCEPVYVISNMAIKASIGLMLLRLAVKPIQRIVIWATLVVTEVYSAAFFFLFIFQCVPSQYFWTRYTGGQGYCVETDIIVANVYAYSAITCVGDWIYAILPCILVWNLQMAKTQKYFVAAILAMGAIASAATVARIPYIHNLSNLADFLYTTSDVAIWSCSETGLGITAASCATLRPLFRTWLMPSAFRTRRTHRSGSERQQQRYAPEEGKVGYSVKIGGGLEAVELTGASKSEYGVQRRGSVSSDAITPSVSSTAGIMHGNRCPQ